jgi:hypothetical protein
MSAALSDSVALCGMMPYSTLHAIMSRVGTDWCCAPRAHRAPLGWLDSNKVANLAAEALVQGWQPASGSATSEKSARLSHRPRVQP